MTSTTPIGFCPHCNQKVLLKRQDIDVCLAIILLIFTAGIGLLIYLVIYYSRKEDRCVHCGTIVERLPFNEIQTTEQLQYTPSKEISEKKTDIAKYCPLCGESLGNRNPSFCAHCGSKIS